LRRDTKKVGLLLYGTGGLGKSCLASKFCERLDHDLIIVHGELNAVTFREALNDAFIRTGDDDGLNLLKEPEEMPDKIRRFCSSTFQKRNYLILLDDFEKNMPEALEVSPEAVPILEALLRYLPYSVKMTRLLITSRHTFTLTFGGTDLVKERRKRIGLTSFQDADERKKISELDHIASYPVPEIRQQLVEAGRGNPRLMEALNALVGEVKDAEIDKLLSKAKSKRDEFVQELVLRQLLETQPDAFGTFLRRSAVYRLSVLEDGIRLICEGLKDWKSDAEKAVRLSLMEEDSTLRDYVRYWVTPLLREDIFGELQEEERRRCHEVAVSYYQAMLSASPDYYEPVSGAKLIEHALKAGLDDIAIEEGGSRFLPYLRNTLAYKEALAQGKHILSHVSKPKRDDKYAKFVFEFGWIYDDTGKAREAISYYEQALSIDKAVYGDRHPDVARDLNNIGEAWRVLGESKKAIEYLEQALSIDKEVHGNRHPNVAIDLSNIGSAWYALGEPKKAIEYYKQALSIGKEVYGERHPDVATYLNNIGSAWDALGEHKKAIEYLEQVLSIDKEVYGERHPDVATDLNNIGSAWNALGEPKKAIEYLEQA
jgi:tetratricopeptide (TPR) repeat protein